MRTDSRQLLAVGIFGRTSVSAPIEALLKRRRQFSPDASRSRLTAILAILLSFPAARAVTPRWIVFAQQSGTSQSPKYEVSSIKPNGGTDFRFAFRIEPNGALTATGITLKRLMMTAWQLQGFRIVGGPAWVDSQRWDVQAKSGVSPAVSNDQRSEMLRTLLKERFQLQIHSEKRDLPIYQLVVDRKGPKFPRVTDTKTKHDVRTANGSIEFTKATVATLASQLSYAVGRPVVDETGISGEFNFALKWTPAPGEDGGPTTSGLPLGTPEQPASTLDGPSIFTAITEQLGLRLKSGQAPVEILVIDHANKPDPN